MSNDNEQFLTQGLPGLHSIIIAASDKKVTLCDGVVFGKIDKSEWEKSHVGDEKKPTFDKYLLSEKIRGLNAMLPSWSRENLADPSQLIEVIQGVKKVHMDRVDVDFKQKDIYRNASNEVKLQ